MFFKYTSFLITGLYVGVILRSTSALLCQKRASEPLELELQPDVGFGNWTWVFNKSSACSKRLNFPSSPLSFIHYLEFVILKCDDKVHRVLAVNEAALAYDAAITWDHATPNTAEAVQ